MKGFTEETMIVKLTREQMN